MLSLYQDSNIAATNDDITPDAADAVIVLASENPANLTAVEAALWGEDVDVDGHTIAFDATFNGIFEQPERWPERRVGFGGPEFQEREDEYETDFLADDQDIPDDAPLSMGFIAGFGESIPEEEAVTLQQGQRFPAPNVDPDVVPTNLDYVGEVGEVGERDPGVFAQGTLHHLSHLEIDLEEWYDTDADSRRHQMYSPYHDKDETRAQGGDKPGSGLVDPDADDPNTVAPDDDTYSVLEYADRTSETAAGADDAETTDPTTAHSQKAARARYDVDGDGEPEQPVLRRDWDAISPVGEDGADRPGYHFYTPMRFNESVYSMLDANYNVAFTSLDGRVDHDHPEDFDAAGLKERNGIAPYLTATRRSNWLMPPITLRALPYPRARRIPDGNLSVRSTGDAYVVEIAGRGDAVDDLDPETVRVGTVEEVNQAGGAEPMNAARRETTTMFAVPVDDTALELGETVKVFAKKARTGNPVVGVTTID